MTMEEFGKFALFWLVAAALTVPSLGIAGLVGTVIGLYLVGRIWLGPRWGR